MAARPTRFDELLKAVKSLVDAERKSLKAAEARGSLPPGSTRARVTTANARWANAAEARDRAMKRVGDAVARANIEVPQEHAPDHFGDGAGLTAEDFDRARDPRGE